MFDAPSPTTATMVAFDEACRRIGELAAPLGVETVALDAAAGRILAEPVTATRNAPPCAVSAMDGYAVREADLRCRQAMPVVGEAFAGRGFDGALPAGACVRIFTGAPLPEGADRVVIQEIVRREARTALLIAAPGEARHVRRAGSDFRAGEVLLDPGAALTPQALVAAAAADVDAIVAYRRPRIAILSTGDELAAPGQAGTIPGAVPESVSLGVAALAQAWGGTVVARRRLPDDLPALIAAAGEAFDAADVVVATGGASVGDMDFAHAMFEPFRLEPVFAKVAIKPGKPVWLARAAGRLVVGLPGNPSAALVTARLFLAPLIAGLAGRAPQDAWRWRTAALTAGLCAGERETFVRARSGPYGAAPLPNQDSSAQRTLAAADLLIRLRPEHGRLAPGARVEVLDF
jgi:molybdopterin molybdotransferase